MPNDNDGLRLDLIIFGATGYTGQYVIENMIKTAEQENQDLKWGIAGRSREKLQKSLDSVLSLAGKQSLDIPLIVADVSDEQSILNMCKRARIIVNCVGPYGLYGEVVVKSCIAGGAHHIDLAGEPAFLEDMQVKYHRAAEEAGVLIVGACGFDSIPVDCGIVELQKRVAAAGGELAWVESFFKTRAGPNGAVINHGTWDSAVQFFADVSKLTQIRNQLFNPQFFKSDKQWPTYRHKNHQKYLPWTPEETGKLTVPFWESDKFVNKRTQFQNYIERNERPVQLTAYLVIGSWLAALATGLVGLVFITFAQFELGRKWLKAKPHWFTVGAVSPDGPSRQQVKEASFECTLVGSGYKQKLASPTDEPSSPPEKLIIGRWRGPEAAYDATSILMIQAAITILKDREAIKYSGGVLTPGLTFRDTTLFERLGRHSVNFEIIKSNI